ncbi:hypothetical protein [Spiroplasma endosymbiont of Danaus chrysippus]|nr:hypothetical protein [Spiroplasma endosymbiont of Danaus chrysippus]
MSTSTLIKLIFLCFSSLATFSNLGPLLATCYLALFTRPLI